MPLYMYRGKDGGTNNIAQVGVIGKAALGSKVDVYGKAGIGTKKTTTWEAGLGYKATENLDINAGYRYINTQATCRCLHPPLILSVLNLI